MSQFNRYLWTGLVLGLAACGDDVTVTNPPQPVVPTPGVTSVSVAPDGATIVVLGKLGMTAAATLEPGAAAPTWAWSSSSTAVATVAGTTASAEVTAVAVGSAGIRATATSGTSSASGVATVTVVAAPVAPSCAITGVSVSPSSANLVVNQTVAVAANVTGTNCSAAQLGVTFTSSSDAIATVSATGLVTAKAAGSVTITATSSTDASKKAAMSVSIVAPQPATVSIQSVTQFATNVPVDLTNVGGQIEITLNVDPGAAPQVTKAQALINGVVVAEQIIPAAAAQAAPSLAPQVLVLSTNTRQVKLAGGLYTPVVYNGPGQITARIYTAASTNPAVSNAVPVVMQNADAVTPPTTFAATNASPSVTVGATTWRKGTISVGGAQYISFYPTGIDSLKWGSSSCGSTGNMVTGSATAGYSLAGTFACTATEDAAVTPGAYTVWQTVPAPAADVVYIAATGMSQVGTAYTVDGSTRYNLLAFTFTTTPSVAIDNVGPTTTANPIGFLSGAIGAGDAAPNNCEETYALANGAGCWVKSDYNIAADFTHADAGVGAPTGGFVSDVTARSGSPLACTSTAFDLTTAAVSSLPTEYVVCGRSADALGNTGTRVAGFNPFGVDNAAPTLTYGAATGAPALVGTLYAQLPSGCANSALTCTNPAVAATVPGQVLSFDITDDRAGVDSLNNIGLKATFAYTVNDGGAAVGTVRTQTAAGTTVTAANPCVRPNTATTSITAQIRRITTAFAPDNGCALPGEYSFSVVGVDRAGNTTSAYVRKMELNGAAGASAPAVTAINRLPLYAAQSDMSWDIFGTDNEDILNASVGLPYITSSGAEIEFVFGPAAGFFTGLFGASWDGSLYLQTPTSGVRMTLPAAYNLRGYADNGAVLAGTPPWAGPGLNTGLNFRVYDSYLAGAGNPYGTPSAIFNQTIPTPFMTTSSWTGATNTANPWAAGTGVSNPAFSASGACTWSYETPTNDPEVVSRLWIANYTPSSGPGVNNVAVILADINAAPTLVSDNGTTRVYRHSINAATCATFIGGAGTKLAVMVKSGAGYVLPPL